MNMMSKDLFSNLKDSNKKGLLCCVTETFTSSTNTHTEETLMCVNYEPLFDIGRV